MIEEIVKDCISEKNKKKLHIILAEYLLESFDKFDENIEYAKNYMDIFENYDGKLFEEEKEKWDEKYLFFEKGKLITNFSKERVEHIKKIIRKIYPERNKKMSSSINYSTESLNKSKRNNEKNSRENILPKIAVGGGIVLTGIGFLTSKTTLAIIGLGLASVGVIYLYKKKN